MLVFDHVSVFYGGTQVLRGLSFSIRDGEQAGLLGANGAGKSTLMKAALGLVPYTGSITVDGLPVTRENLPAVRRKLGYVLQDADNQMFMPTVLDDMLFGPMNYGLSRARPETKLIASHDLDLVLETCRRVLLIADGALAADGPAQELLRDKALLEANGLELPLCLAGVPEF